MLSNCTGALKSSLLLLACAAFVSDQRKQRDFCEKIKEPVPVKFTTEAPSQQSKAELVLLVQAGAERP